MQNGIDGWHAVHRDGKEFAADGMTKPLAGQAFVKFRNMLFMRDCSETGSTEEKAHDKERREVHEPTSTMREGGLVGSMGLVYLP